MTMMIPVPVDKQPLACVADYSCDKGEFLQNVQCAVGDVTNENRRNKVNRRIMAIEVHG
jgi:hypothetical protein